MSTLPQALKKWWNRPCGVGYLLAVAVPLMVSTVCYSVMQFVDRLFLFQHSELEAGAIVTVGTMVWALISLPFGMVGYLSTFIAQYRGADRWDRMGRAVTHATYVCLLSLPLILAPALITDRLFPWLGHGPELSEMQSRCFLVYALSGIAMVAAGVLEGVLVGLERNRPIMYANLFGTLVNLALDPLMIFGGWGIPEMGIMGAAWATVIGMWAKFLFTWVAVLGLKELPRFQWRESWRLDFRFLWRFIYYGFPSGFQWAVEGTAMAYFVFVMGKLGETFLAATSLAFSVNMLAFVPIYGLGMALSAVIGNQLGRDDPKLAVRAVSSGLMVALAYTSVFSLLYLTAPDLLLKLHRDGGESFQAIGPIVKRFLFFVALYCVLDAVQIVMVSVLKGAGDTWFVTATITGTSLAFVGGGISVERQSVSPAAAADRWWLLLTCWLSLLAVIYTVRVLRGRWLLMRVIETSAATSPVAGEGS